MLSFLQDILAPKICYWCKTQWHFLCFLCQQKIHKHRPICYVCKRPSGWFQTHISCQNSFSLDRVLLFARYRDQIISRLIKHAKFYNKHSIWKDLIDIYARLIWEHIVDDISHYIIVAVPMYKWKKRFRGYNPCEILAEGIGKQLNIRVENKLIYKVWTSVAQAQLSQKQRRENVKNMFKINEKLIDNISWKSIIIIDDVISTGATLDSISQLLKTQQAHQTIWCVFASD